MPGPHREPQKDAGDVKLFNKDGQYVTTVNRGAAPVPPGIILWKERYFALGNGAYVESSVFRADELPR